MPVDSTLLPLIPKRPAREADPIAYSALVHIRETCHALGYAPPPEVAMFLGVFEDDPDTVKMALDQGANRELMLGQVFSQHASFLRDFHPYGVTEAHRGVAEDPGFPADAMSHVFPDR